MRMRKSLAVRISGAILLCLLLLLPACASAIDPIDMTQLNSLTINCTVPEGDQAGGTPTKLKTTFRLYRVADMVTPFAEFEFTGAFEQYKDEIIINGLDSAGWKRAAQTLATYAEADNIAPLVTYTVTNSSPNNAPRINNLRAGLYLVTFDRVVIGKWIYTMAPILVSLPTRENGSDEWIHDVSISATKWQAEERDMLNLTVLKVWNDKGWESSRPKKITIELLRNNKVYDRITLPGDNNKWSYTWYELDPDYRWSIRENPVPEHYTVDIDQEGNTSYIITNYRPGNNDDENDGKLPQTGLDWWPVAALAVSGMTLFFLGWLRRRQEDDDEEEAEA